MDDRTRATFETLSEQLTETARRLGELTLAYERLARRRQERPAPAGDTAPAAPEQDAAAGTGEEMARQDRITYLETARAALYRLLFVVDFSLAHDRVDRALLADARTTLVEGVDAVDACLMLDGVGLPPVVEG